MKAPQSSIDKILSELSEDDRAEFLEFCRFNPTYSDIKARLKELGHDASVSSIQRWYLRSFPVGDEAKKLNALMTPYAGADSLGALQMSLGVSTQLIDSFMQLLGQDELEKLKDRPATIAYQLSILLKEMRVTAAAINQQQVIRDRKSLELAGGYRLAELIKSFSESDPNFAVIEALINAALSQLEDEINR
jgi:hypothetical protein